MLCPCDIRKIDPTAPPSATVLERAGPFIVAGGAAHLAYSAWSYATYHMDDDVAGWPGGCRSCWLNGLPDGALLMFYIIAISSVILFVIVALAVLARVLAQLFPCPQLVGLHRSLERACRPPSLLLLSLASASVITSMVFTIMVAVHSKDSAANSSFIAALPFGLWHFASAFMILLPWFLKFMGVETDADQKYLGSGATTAALLEEGRVPSSSSSAKPISTAPVAVALPLPPASGAELDAETVDMLTHQVVAPQLPPPPMVLHPNARSEV